MILNLVGPADLWIDGELTASGHLHRVKLPDSRPQQIALRCHPQATANRGTNFKGPVRYNIGKGRIDKLESWNELGLESWSGGLRYETEFSWDRPGHTWATIDLGEIRGSAEVTLNGTPIGTRVTGPFHFDATEFLRAGKNKLDILVLNTLAPYLRSSAPSNFVPSDDYNYGLFGPVTVTCS